MTYKQKQALLAYLGYYVGDIDGIWGSGSRAAANAFKADYGVAADDKTLLQAVNGTIQPKEKDTGWDSIRYFKREEFKCKCGRYCNGYPAEIDLGMVSIADSIRARLGKPLTVNSGLRCRQHNANVDGVENSQHMYGEAADIYVWGVNPDTALAWFQSQSDVRFAYRIEGSNNIHFDIEKQNR